MRLAPGRATTLFTLDGATPLSDTLTQREGEEEGRSGGPKVDSGVFIPVRSFANEVRRITVTKRPGMENVPLLVESGKDEGAFEQEQGNGSGYDDGDDYDDDSLFAQVQGLFCHSPYQYTLAAFPIINNINTPS